MKIPLNEFEQLIDEKILKRGLSYYKSGTISNFSEISTGEYEAIVSGTEEYTVQLEVSNNTIVEHNCDCPYDMGSVCKHIVAVIFHLQQGELELNQTNLKTDIVFNMITVPFTANYYFGNNDNWYVNLGPYIGFMIAAKGKTQNVDITELYNSTDFGIAGGIGYKIPISNELDLFAEIDNQAGLSDIIKNNSGSAIRNNRFSFNIGIIF